MKKSICIISYLLTAVFSATAAVVDFDAAADLSSFSPSGGSSAVLSHDSGTGIGGVAGFLDPDTGGEIYLNTGLAKTTGETYRVSYAIQIGTPAGDINDFEAGFIRSSGSNFGGGGDSANAYLRSDGGVSTYTIELRKSNTSVSETAQFSLTANRWYELRFDMTLDSDTQVDLVAGLYDLGADGTNEATLVSGSSISTNDVALTNNGFNGTELFASFSGRNNTGNVALGIDNFFSEAGIEVEIPFDPPAGTIQFDTVSDLTNFTATTLNSSKVLTHESGPGIAGKAGFINADTDGGGEFYNNTGLTKIIGESYRVSYAIKIGTPANDLNDFRAGFIRNEFSQFYGSGDSAHAYLRSDSGVSTYTIELRKDNTSISETSQFPLTANRWYELRLYMTLDSETQVDLVAGLYDLGADGTSAGTLVSGSLISTNDIAMTDGGFSGTELFAAFSGRNDTGNVALGIDNFLSEAGAEVEIPFVPPEGTITFDTASDTNSFSVSSGSSAVLLHHSGPGIAEKAGFLDPDTGGEVYLNTGLAKTTGEIYRVSYAIKIGTPANDINDFRAGFIRSTGSNFQGGGDSVNTYLRSDAGVSTYTIELFSGGSSVSETTPFSLTANRWYELRLELTLDSDTQVNLVAGLYDLGTNGTSEAALVAGSSISTNDVALTDSGFSGTELFASFSGRNNTGNVALGIDNFFAKDMGAAPGPTPSRGARLLTDESVVTGAVIDESVIDITVYMATDGNDGNDGLSSSNAVKTLSRATAVALAQNNLNRTVKVLIADGVYRSLLDTADVLENSSSKPIIYEAENIGQAVFKGSDIWTGWTDEGSGVWSKDWNFDWGAPHSQWIPVFAYEGGMPDGAVNDLAIRREVVVVDGVLLAQVEEYSDLTDTHEFSGEGTFYVDETADKIYLKLRTEKNPNTLTTEVAVRPEDMFDATGREESIFYLTKHNIVIRGLVLKHFAMPFRPIIESRGMDNLLIEDCFISQNPHAAYQNAGGGFEADQEITGLTIRRCEFTENGYMGMSIGGLGVNNLLAENLKLNSNALRGRQAGLTGHANAGTKISVTSGAVFLNCEANYNYANGWWVDLDAQNTTFRNCDAIGNWRIGFDIEATQGPILIDGCRSENNMVWQLSCAAAEDVTVRNSVFWRDTVQSDDGYADKPGVFSVWQEDRTFKDAVTGEDVTVVPKHWTFENNAFRGVNGRFFNRFGYDNPIYTDFLDTLLSDSNIFYMVQQPSLSFNTYSGAYTNLTGWQAATGQDLNSEFVTDFPPNVFNPIVQWRKETFGSYMDEGDAADLADPNTNGMVNLVEYALGRDPLSVAPGQPYPAKDFTTVSNESYLTMNVPKNPEATDVSFRFDVSDDLLETWSVGTEYTTVVSETQTNLVVRDKVPVSSADQRFMQLKVELNP